MVWAILVLIFCVLVAAAINKKQATDHDWPTFAKTVLTKHEQPAFWKLQKALPDHVVLAQVQLSRFLGVNTTNKRQSWLNRIDRKSADFVVCRRDFTVAAVIELDDSSHDSAKARQRDADKDAALSAAGIRVVRWRTLPDADGIRRAVGIA